MHGSLRAIHLPGEGRASVKHQELSPTLSRRLLLGGLALGAAGPALAQGQGQGTDRGALLTGSRSVATALAAELDRQWDRLKSVATTLERNPSASPGVVRGILNEAQRDAPHTVWIGVANPRDGRVVAGSGGILEGADVTERPWYRVARTQDFAGDVHGAVLLDRVLARGPGAEPLRLIDFARPIKAANGTVTGVLGSHVDWQWILTIIRNAPVPAGATVAVINQHNQVLFGLAGRWLSDLARYPVAPVLQRQDAPSLSWRAVGLPEAMLRG